MGYAKHELLSIAGKLSVLRHYPDKADEVEDLKRERAALRIEAYVRKIVTDAPPLSDEQRDRISALVKKIQPSGGAE